MLLQVLGWQLVGEVVHRVERELQEERPAVVLPQELARPLSQQLRAEALLVDFILAVPERSLLQTLAAAPVLAPGVLKALLRRSRVAQVAA